MPGQAKGHKIGYADVKIEIRQMIEAGGWKPGVRLPPERDLAEQFSCARLTVRRALQELQAEGVVVRRHGSGSYVADLRPISNVLTVRDIHEEILERGHRHTSRVLSRGEFKTDEALADAFELAVGATVYGCEVLHYENGTPIQLEERYVNPAVVPDFLSIDLGSRTASSYLFEHAPLTAAEQVIEAVNANAVLAGHLEVAPGTALLRVSRRTVSRGRVASVARLFHPGERFRLMGSFSTQGA